MSTQEQESPPLWQSIFAGVINHQINAGIIKALDYLESLSDDELLDLTEGMSPRDRSRVARVVDAARGRLVPAIRSEVPAATAQVEVVELKP